ncbi:STAS domain-containing protein [Mycobacterium sp. URHB0044]|jgi:anti-anti-sigma factor|uniref:STAS domain-containing protein n=1 Tax=Mycobacterium sp. URHB0044 TaxID=1380386 RepID=UPI00048F0FC8|nr:STAS domain-containing protein [Mycobacterium sp. URHB0044]
MSTFESSRPAAPESEITCHTARLATRWLHPSVVVVVANGELDAANAQDFVSYALRHADAVNHLVLDLEGIEFFGASGFSALHTLNVRCAADGTEWAMVPGKAVTRLLQICDPDTTLPVAADLDAALDIVHGAQRRLLQLVPQAR